jgi:hypothetical protein
MGYLIASVRRLNEHRKALDNERPEALRQQCPEPDHHECRMRAIMTADDYPIPMPTSGYVSQVTHRTAVPRWGSP